MAARVRTRLARDAAWVAPEPHGNVRRVRRQVVISGVGCVSSLGGDSASFTNRLLAGCSGVRRLDEFDGLTLRARHAARVSGFNPTAYLPPLKLRRIDPVGRLTYAAASQALAGAGMDKRPDGYDEVGVVLGSFSAGVHATGEFLVSYRRDGGAAAPALLFSNTVGNAPASLCALEFRLRGPNTTLMQKEASGLAAIVMGAHLVRHGRAEAILAGGADHIFEHFYLVHDHFGVMAYDRGDGAICRPFDAARSGFVMGEGAYLVMLEHEAHCRARGVQPMARVLGWASSAESLPVNAWPSSGAALARSMRDALSAASLTPSDIDAVYASANGSVPLDRAEAAALREVFGARRVPVTSIKGAVGECGASGAASLAAAVLCGASGYAAPTAGFQRTAPDCPVTVAIGALPLAGPRLLINSFASGGTNVSVIVEMTGGARPEGAASV
jgi:3-oxoacyl-[acyl-carrier-protein] synthase II